MSKFSAPAAPKIGHLTQLFLKISKNSHFSSPSSPKKWSPNRQNHPLFLRGSPLPIRALVITLHERGDVFGASTVGEFLGIYGFRTFLSGRIFFWGGGPRSVYEKLAQYMHILALFQLEGVQFFSELKNKYLCDICHIFSNQKIPTEELNFLCYTLTLQ